MPSTCIGICERYRALKQYGEPRYASGQKRCNECGIYVWWKGALCPCCHTVLRRKPRASAYRRRYRERMDK